MEVVELFAPKSLLAAQAPPRHDVTDSSSIQGREYTAQSSKECRIWLLDTSALGGEDHRTPVHQTPLVCNEEVHVQLALAPQWGALASWEGCCGTPI